MHTRRAHLGQALAIARTRKIPCIGVLAIATLACTAPAGATAAPDLLHATIFQRGQGLVFQVLASPRVGLASLDRLPDETSSRYLCLELRRVGRRGSRRLCLGGRRRTRRRVGWELLNAAGRPVAKHDLSATVRWTVESRLVAKVLPADAGLRPGRYAWRIVTRLGCADANPTPCEAQLPSKGSRTFRLRPVRPVGCTIGRPEGVITNGSRERNVVALTFDDGPSEYTPAFLAVLREKHVPATFFEIGQEIPGRESILRQIIRAGDEIGNHTTHHTELPTYADIDPTTRLIESTTHFRPCLFRPPGGAVDASVLEAADQDLLETITWDVDPSDWSEPGSASIYRRVVDATRPGSIVLMHDGGGPRGETLAALPSIIDTLRARGYRFATVTQLLGRQMRYMPYG